MTVPKEDPPVWNSWQDVRKDAREVATFGRWFVEVFSGTARLTQTVRAGKVPCLPPIDITLCAAIPFAFDVVNLDQWEFFMQLIFFGCIFFAHFGTPCNSYSGARKDDGGPPPLRSSEFPDGLPVLSDRICALFSWATCSMRGPVKPALLSSQLISRSRILWGASYGKLHL